MSNIIWLSPSQIDTFQHCQRKWGWRYLNKIILPPNYAAEIGLRGHGILEKYLTTAHLNPLESDLHHLCSMGAHLYPAPCTPGLQIEHHFGCMIGGYRFHGYKDVQLLQRPLSHGRCVGCSDTTRCDECLPRVWDHKFTSNLRWAKSDEVLRTDTQAVIYLFDAMLKADYPKARGTWVYYQRKGARKIQRSEVTLRVEDLSVPLKEILKAAAKIHYIRKNYTSALQLPPNVLACSDFGGCGYSSLCNLTPKDRFTSLIKSEKARLVWQQ